MSEPGKIIKFPKPEADDSRMIVTMTVADLRRIVAEEIRAAIGNGNGSSPALLSAEQAAKALGVPRSWISEAARRGEIPHVRLGHYVRFRCEDLDRFIEKQRRKENS